MKTKVQFPQFTELRGPLARYKKPNFPIYPEQEWVTREKKFQESDFLCFVTTLPIIGEFTFYSSNSLRMWELQVTLCNLHSVGPTFSSFPLSIKYLLSMCTKHCDRWLSLPTLSKYCPRFDVRLSSALGKPGKKLQATRKDQLAWVYDL